MPGVNCPCITNKLPKKPQIMAPMSVQFAAVVSAPGTEQGNSKTAIVFKLGLNLIQLILLEKVKEFFRP